ncbi:MAG: hypothetical protein ACREV5_01840 [Steroidobacter sp.]
MSITVRVSRNTSFFLALMGSLVAVAVTSVEAQTPPAQPSYPAAPQSQDPSNPLPRNTDPAPDVEPRCDRLSGLEKSECERRDITDDNAPAGVTTSTQQQQDEKTRDHNEVAPSASEAESDTDTMGERPTQSKTRMRQAARDRADRNETGADEEQSDAAQDEDANRREQQTESNSETDTLGPPDS